MADNRIPSSEFRTTYSSLSEPVEVTVLGRVIGTYYPKGTEGAGEAILLAQRNALETDRANLAAEVKYLKSELAKRLTTKVEPVPMRTTLHTNAIAGEQPRRGVSASFGHSTPAPKGN